MSTRARHHPWFRPGPVDFVATGRLLAHDRSLDESRTATWGESPWWRAFKATMRLRALQDAMHRVDETTVRQPLGDRPR